MSRSGFYKWRKRGGDPPKDRAKVLRLVQGCHDAHPSHGYRWVHAYLKRSDGITVSAEYVRRCFLYLGIRAETKHQKKDRERKARDPYPNLIFSTWETVDRPRQVIVSDMTAFWTRSRYWELALYFDVFTKQIIGRGLTMLPPMYFPPFTPMIHNRSRQPAPAGYANVFPPLSAPPPNLSRNARASRARALSEPG